MALNPPLNEHGDPFRMQGEFYILSRVGIEFEIKIPSMGKLKGKGKCVLTTHRIILLNHKSKGDDMRAFDLPLALMFNESFEQPIFGANYITGKTKPLTPNSLPGDPEFKMWFMEGGCGKFLKSWRLCLHKIRQNQANKTNYDLGQYF